MKIYEIAVFFNPKEHDGKNAEKAKLLVEPKSILAKTEQAAQVAAARMIPDAYAERLDDVVVAVRPF